MIEVNWLERNRKQSTTVGTENDRFSTFIQILSAQVKGYSRKNTLGIWHPNCTSNSKEKKKQWW